MKKDVHDEVVDDLNSNIEYLRTRGNDFEDELALKYKEVEDLQEIIKQNSSEVNLKSSSSSLAEELQDASAGLDGCEQPIEEIEALEPFACDHCNLKFLSVKDLREHNAKVTQDILTKRINFLTQMNIMEQDLSQLKSDVSNSLFKLKQIESDKAKTCTCKGY